MSHGSTIGLGKTAMPDKDRLKQAGDLFADERPTCVGDRHLQT